MKRNNKLIYEICAIIERHDQLITKPELFRTLLGFTDTEIAYHVLLCRDRKLIDDYDSGRFRLTDLGHSFVECNNPNLAKPNLEMPPIAVY